MSTPICRFCKHYDETDMLCTRRGESWSTTDEVTGHVTRHNDYPTARTEREQYRIFLPGWFPALPWRCGPKGRFFAPLGE